MQNLKHVESSLQHIDMRMLFEKSITQIVQYIYYSLILKIMVLNALKRLNICQRLLLVQINLGRWEKVLFVIVHTVLVFWKSRLNFCISS